MPCLGKHKHDLLPSCWLFWLNGRWYRSTKPKPKPKQVVEYSEISKETSELREGGRSDNSIHSKEKNYLVKILGWYTYFLNIFAGWYTERETFATTSSQEISYRWRSPKIQKTQYFWSEMAQKNSNIKIYIKLREFLQRVCLEHEKQLPHHIAKKKIPFTDLATGNPVK